jgi:hypothetical protein
MLKTSGSNPDELLFRDLDQTIVLLKKLGWKTERQGVSL